MRSRPESMERWGVVDIFTEAAALLHRHFRLFVPFFFAFCLPASFMLVFRSVFLKIAAAPPLEIPSLDFNSTALSTITQILYHQMQPKLILTYTLWLLGFLLDILALAAFTYIVAHVYSNVKTESDDDSIVKAVRKLLRPRIIYRICMTHLWVLLVCIPVNLAWFTAVSILFGISPSGVPKAFNIEVYTFFNIEVSNLIGVIPVTIMLAFAEPIALLEPDKYGRAALQLGLQYVKRRAGTTFCIAVFSVTIAELGSASAQAVANLGLSLWVKITAASLLSILSSVVSAYVGLVFLVVYFVCKSSFEAALPTFQHSSTKVKSAADGMEMVLPDGIERWGLGAILKEAGRLIRRHYRLFMPFFLAIQLPASLLPVFHIVFLIAGSRPSLHSKSSIANDTSPSELYYQSVGNRTGPSFSFKRNYVNGTDRLLYDGPALYYESLVNDQKSEVHYKRLLVNGTLRSDELYCYVSQLYYKSSFNNSPELYDEVPQLYYKSLGNGSTGSEVFDLIPQLYYKVPSHLCYKSLANGTGSQLFPVPQLYYKNFDNGTALELYNKVPQLYYDQTFSNGTSSHVFDKVPQLYYEVPPLRFKDFDGNGTTVQEGGNGVAKKASSLQPSSILAACTLWVLKLFFSTLTLAAFSIIVPSIYSKADTKPENDPIIKCVFKLVPHAFLRILVTGTWETLVWIPAAIAGAIAFHFGGSSWATPTFILFVVVPFVIAIIGIMVVFMLAKSIAVFEPERYGRAALKQSCKYAKGRPGTIFCIITFSKLMGELNSIAVQAVAKAGLPVLVKIIVEILLGILMSVLSAYFALVGVVVYLVCKSYSEPVHTE